MQRFPMLDNILAQPRSLAAVLAHHTGPGAPALAAAAQLLRSATGRVLLSGMGASLFAAMPAADQLEQHGRPTRLAPSSELLHFGAGSFHPTDLAVLISRSGASVEVLRLAEHLHAARIPILAITNLPDSPLAQLSHAVVLTTPPDEHIADQIVAVQTYTATLLTLLLLAEQVTIPQTPQLPAALAHLLPSLPDHLASLIEVSGSWEPFLSGDQPLYLLGRGPALAAVHEGSLLFHETAKLTATPLSSGQFRHGPVEAITPGSRILVLGTPSSTRALEASLATDLAAMRAEVRWIGPVPPGPSTLTPLAPWPANLPAVLHPIAEVLPLQLAAYRAALWRGLSPGHFRYAAEITAAETGFPLLQPAPELTSNDDSVNDSLTAAEPIATTKL